MRIRGDRISHALLARGDNIYSHSGDQVILHVSSEIVVSLLGFIFRGNPCPNRQTQDTYENVQHGTVGNRELDVT